jgi:transposase
MGQMGFWDVEQRYALLVQKHDLLIRLDKIVPWEMFRPLLNQVHEKERKSNAGRKPIDVMILFKMLILQHLYNISDEKLEYLVNDRLSFMKFLHLGIEDKVPDATTVWLFREALIKKELIKELY